MNREQQSWGSDRVLPGPAGMHWMSWEASNALWAKILLALLSLLLIFIKGKVTPCDLWSREEVGEPALCAIQGYLCRPWIAVL